LDGQKIKGEKKPFCLKIKRFFLNFPVYVNVNGFAFCSPCEIGSENSRNDADFFTSQGIKTMPSKNQFMGAIAVLAVFIAYKQIAARVGLPSA
jgi:hypothetical protein